MFKFDPEHELFNMDPFRIGSFAEPASFGSQPFHTCRFALALHANISRRFFGQAVTGMMAPCSSSIDVPRSGASCSSALPHVQPQASINLLTTVVTDSPHAAGVEPNMLLRTLASFAIVPDLLRDVRLVFDGATPPSNTRGYSWKCKQAADESAYAAYKARARAALQQLPAVGALTVLELPTRRCHSGTVRAGVANTTSLFVAVLQNDLPLLKPFDLRALLAVMTEHPYVQKVSFSAGTNACNRRVATTICKKHRKLGRSAVVPELSLAVPLTVVQFWWDGNHVASAAHYRRVFSQRVTDGGFVENAVFCRPWLNHSEWGTYMLGNMSDGRYSAHANARNTTFAFNLCMN